MELQKIYTEETKNLISFAESRIGGRPENQDSYGWANTLLGYLVTVCDGMGGGPGGKTASTIAVDNIIAGVKEASKDEEISNGSDVKLTAEDVYQIFRKAAGK